MWAKSKGIVSDGSIEEADEVAFTFFFVLLYLNMLPSILLSKFHICF